MKFKDLMKARNTLISINYSHSKTASYEGGSITALVIMGERVTPYEITETELINKDLPKSAIHSFSESMASARARAFDINNASREVG